MSENKADKQKPAKNTLKRTLIEWGVILSVAALLYITGYHTEVIGTIQRVLLVTGIHQPHTPSEGTQNFPKASYDLEMNNLEGERASLDDFRGKTIFINFWATWCPPCIAEMPNIQLLYDDVSGQDDIVFVMISLDDDPAKARAFINRKEFTFPVYFPVSRMPSMYNKAIVPRTYVISPGGDIVVEHEGMAKYHTDNFKEFLLSL